MRRLAFTLLLLALAAPALARKLAAPVAKRVEHTESIHGIERRDDWRWLRERDDPAVTDYLKAENAYAEQVMAPAAGLRKAVAGELRARLVEDDTDVPVQRGKWQYYRRVEAGKAYPIYARKAADGKEQILLDLNVLAEGHDYLDLGVYEPSDDGRWLAYSLDTAGDETYTLHVLDLETGKPGAEAIPAVQEAEWTPDGTRLVYTVRDPTFRAHQLWCHVRGQDGARLLYEEKDARYDLVLERTRSGAYLVLSAVSYDAVEARIAPAAKPEGKWTVIAERLPGHRYEVDHDGGKQLYIRTNLDAPTYRIVTAPVADPRKKNWKDHIAARDGVVLTRLDAFDGYLVVFEREDGQQQLGVYGRDVRDRRIPVESAGYGLYPGENPSFDAPTYRFIYESMRTPTTVLELDLAGGAIRVLKETPVGGDYDADAYVTARRVAKAKDGIEIPITLIWRDDRLKPGKPAPLVLEGYGAYGDAYDGYFDSRRISLLDRGVIVAIAHVRGGGEYGDAWHDAGKLGEKMTTFTDYLAVAEALIADGVTKQGWIVAYGESAGGLLIGAVLNLRPELFAAAVLRVPFVDAINSMLDADLPLTTNEYQEWGDPRVAKEYAWIAAYSPYDNLAARAYPTLLAEASLEDGRVMYWESAKYVARLRTVDKTPATPALLRTAMGAGHGGKSGRYAQLDEQAWELSFMLWQLGIKK